MDFLTFCKNFKTDLYKKLPCQLGNENLENLILKHTIEFIEEYKKMGWIEQNIYIVNNLEFQCSAIVEQMIKDFYKNK